MNRVLSTALVCATIALSACGGSDDDPPSKPLFSLWTAENGAKNDVRNGNFSQPFGLSSFYANGAQCSCTVTVIGEEASGRIAINSCRFVVGSYAGGDPGCSASNGVYSYTNNNAILTLTSPDGYVSTYR